MTLLYNHDFLVDFDRLKMYKLRNGNLIDLGTYHKDILHKHQQIITRLRRQLKW